MTKITITDTPEIEALQQELDELARKANALRAKRDELKAANTAKVLADAGIVFEKTKVLVKESWMRTPQPFFVMFVRPQGQIEFAKVKADGTPSKASSGLPNVTTFEVIE